jgi:hypothetical protein
MAWQLGHHHCRVVVTLAWPLFKITGGMQQARDTGKSCCAGELQRSGDVPLKGETRQLTSDGEGLVVKIWWGYQHPAVLGNPLV